MTSNLLRAAMIAMAVVSMVGGAGEASAALNEEPEVQHFFSPALTIHFKGLTVRNEDVVRFVPATDEAEIVFNGSAFGLSWENVDSVVAQADGTFLLSFKTTAYLPGFGYVEDEDVVQFTPDESDPANAGTFSIFLKGDDIGIFGYRTDINAFSTNTGTQTCDLELFLSPPEDDDAIIQRAKDICRIVFALGTEPDPFTCLDPIDSAICNVIEGFGCSGLLQP